MADRKQCVSLITGGPTNGVQDRRLARLCWDPRRLLNPELVDSSQVADIASDILGGYAEIRTLLVSED